MSASLVAERVTVRFQGLVANDNVSLEVDAGSISALIGPNGAGKTTLFNVISGLLAPDDGRIRLGDVDVTELSTRRRAQLGMARTFQSLMLAPSLTAIDNVLMGAARMGRFSRVSNLFRSDALSSSTLRRRAIDALAFVDASHTANQRVSSLPFGDRRRVELARAIAWPPELLILDEPASGLPKDETDELASIIRRVRDDLATTVLVIEHDMAFVRQVAAHTTVLDFGSVLASGETEQVLTNPDVVAAYLGRSAVEEAAPVAARRRRSAPLVASIPDDRGSALEECE